MLVFLKDLWKSNFIIAYDVLTVGSFEKQDFITIQLETKKDIHLFLLTNMITMTPGTLSVKINEERTELLVHSLYNYDPKAIESSIMANQRLIKEIF